MSRACQWIVPHLCIILHGEIPFWICSDLGFVMRDVLNL